MMIQKLEKRGKDILKRLTPAALRTLAAEIREFLVHSISDTGGHLASNLGVVELTLALHTVFNTPHDKIVWDVGHQAYVHKILTGRKNRFTELRQLDGLSGFPKPYESEHDCFGTGHSSTAISAALGLALARDIREANEEKTKSQRERVVAIIGDGSITGGLAYEGLNNAGRANTDLLVILNDNQMSISKNVGAVSRHLNELRTANAYLSTKEGVQHVLNKLPLIGEPLTKKIESTKNRLKYSLIQGGVLFEELGFKYIGPVDGHDIPALLNVLQQARSMKGAVLLHVRTTKGKGYNIAEKSPSSYHGVGTFCVKTGKPMTKPSAPSYTDVFSKHLCRRAARDSRIVAITAAMSDGTGLERFKERFPKRFFDVGIAEGHAVTFAAGLAKGGLRPVFAVYSSFLQRAYDQILHDVAVQNLPVIFAIDHAGAVCRDGETHQGIYDIAFLSHIPNIVILAPSSGAELNEMLDFALNHDGPVAIRYPKEVAPEDFSEELLLHNGKKIAIVSVGAMLDTARQVAEKFSAEQNESVGLYNARFVKPIAPDLIAQLRKYDYVFTIEDGIKIGGFGEKLALSLSEENVKVHNFAFPDIFPETGTRTELFTRYELDAESIYKKIKTTIKEN